MLFRFLSGLRVLREPLNRTIFQFYTHFGHIPIPRPRETRISQTGRTCLTTQTFWTPITLILDIGPHSGLHCPRRTVLYKAAFPSVQRHVQHNHCMMFLPKTPSPASFDKTGIQFLFSTFPSVRESLNILLPIFPIGFQDSRVVREPSSRTIFIFLAFQLFQS